MPQKAQNWPIFLLKIYRNLLSSICRKIGKMNLSIIIDKLSVIGNSSPVIGTVVTHRLGRKKIIDWDTIFHDFLLTESQF